MAALRPALLLLALAVAALAHTLLLEQKKLTLCPEHGHFVRESTFAHDRVAGWFDRRVQRYRSDGPSLAGHLNSTSIMRDGFLFIGSLEPRAQCVAHRCPGAADHCPSAGAFVWRGSCAVLSTNSEDSESVYAVPVRWWQLQVPWTR